MFFRRAKPQHLTFEDRLAEVRRAGFTVEPAGNGHVLVSRQGCGVLLADAGNGHPQAGKAGVLLGTEIAHLVDGGYQKFFLTAKGQKIPAQADQLKAIHAFTEDLREALGLTSLYNTSLGTTSAAHLYDRVKDRDRGVPKRPWENKPAS